MAKKILVIDDEVDVLKMVAFILRKKNFEVTTATSGEEGLDLALKEKPDLIILDILMPIMDGVEVAKRLGADKELQHIPRMLLTASVDNIHEKVKSCKACDYVLKPFDYQELSRKAELILGDNGERKEDIIS